MDPSYAVLATLSHNQTWLSSEASEVQPKVYRHAPYLVAKNLVGVQKAISKEED